MKILSDGRWLLSHHEIETKIWEKITTWRLEPDGRHMVPDFPKCPHRELKAKCQPCGKTSALNYWCEKKKTFVSVQYCKVCVSREEHL